ncbi:unnamed protein product [Dibothriocephalus latus]|uniref:Uncharacterized protein n=1 Tax=Dibothriocephalus latus TaxID=60516 RepID=A0A3P6SJY7_DIBLA|nr:unnamed protein product [Dibothriocephalus latus]
MLTTSSVIALPFNGKSEFSRYLQPQARFLVGLYGTADAVDSERPEPSDNLDDYAVSEDDNSDSEGRQGNAFDEIEKARFLVGCQSVRPNGSRVHLVTLEEHNSSQGAMLTSQSFIHADGEVLGLAAFPAAPHIFASIYSASKQHVTRYL